MSGCKRKNGGHEEEVTMKRVQTDEVMEEVMTEIARPSTPPLGMTLSHYNAATGQYISSQLETQDKINSPICSGMTPVYKPSFERWGSCTL